MSAQGTEPGMWAKWDAHRCACPQCLAASRPKDTTRPADMTQMCLEGGVLYCAWSMALGEAQHQDEADSDRSEP